MLFTRQRFEEYFTKWSNGDTEYLKTVFAKDVVFRVPGQPPYEGLNAVLEFNKFLQTMCAESVQITSFVTDGETAHAVLFTVTLVFHVDVPAFLGETDIKRGDIIIADTAGFV